MREHTASDGGGGGGREREGGVVWGRGIGNKPTADDDKRELMTRPRAKKHNTRNADSRSEKPEQAGKHGRTGRGERKIIKGEEGRLRNVPL